MKIALGCDHGALELKNLVAAHLQKQGHEITDFGTYTSASCDYPEFAAAAARAVADGSHDPESAFPLPPTRSPASAAPCCPT